MGAGPNRIEIPSDEIQAHVQSMLVISANIFENRSENFSKEGTAIAGKKFVKLIDKSRKVSETAVAKLGNSRKPRWSPVAS